MGLEGYKLIVTIVNKGKGEKVANITHHAGAEGGTILFGRGTAVRLLLGISIEPEKDIVLTLIEKDKARTVLDAIVEKMDLNEPNRGIAFILPLDQVVGINKSY
ncbi:P-II family nitrogen regulator [Desulfoscipio sp. XC116]|uniref:P-II family nitrogen regulator n=1 Tax=Desulfoscipio sp. XC116 TaxID=3144975 RepID=UPI00325B24FC